MDIPATAGRILTEEHFRAFLKCPQFFHQGGEYKGRFELDIAKTAFEKITCMCLRHQFSDPYKIMKTYLVRAAASNKKFRRLVEANQKALLNKITLFLDSIYRTIPPYRYMPTYGPIEYTVKIRKTPVVPRLSAFLHTRKNLALHAVTFSPYATIYDIKRDPILLLKMATLKDLPFVPRHKRKEDIVLHVFGMKGNIYESIYCRVGDAGLSTEDYAIVEKIVETMEIGYNHPIMPCATSRCWCLGNE